MEGKKSKRKTVDSLQDLTGQESGIVIYGDEMIICNWSGNSGLPRVDPFGFSTVGLAEAIPWSKGEAISSQQLAGMLDGLTIVYDVNDDAPSLLKGEQGGRKFELDGNIIVIAPEGWN